MWFGLTEVAAVLAVTINKVPTVAAIVRDGHQGARPLALFEMTARLASSSTRVLTRVILPQLAPSLMAAARAGLALTWQDRAGGGAARPAERRSGSRSARFFNFFRHRQHPGLLRWRSSRAVVAIETFLPQPIDRRLGAWRRA